MTTELKPVEILQSMLLPDETISTYVIANEYHKYYCISQKDKTDLGGFLEDTLHRLLDFQYDEEDIHNITGMVITDNPKIPIDLNYGIIDDILYYEKNINDYQTIIKNYKPFLIKTLNPDEHHRYIVIAYNEETAVRQTASEHNIPIGSLYAEEITIEDGSIMII